MTTSIRPTTGNTIGLMATGIPTACMLDGQNTRPRIKADTKPVTVMLRSGQLEDDGSQLVLWSHIKGGTYDIEAAYDHRSISREDAEQHLRAELARHGMDVTTFLDKQRTTALAAALYIAQYGYKLALASPNPAARLDDMCDAVSESWDDITPKLPKKFAGADLEFAETMQAAVADRLWAFTVVAHARAEVGEDFGYVLDILADNLKNGRDPQAVRDEVPRVVEKLRAACPEPRTWTYVRRSDRATVSVTCPSWCERDHKMSQYLTENPEDITHQACGREATVEANGDGTYEEWRLLGSQLDAAPDAEDAHYREPHVMVELVDDVWSRPMGPDELAAFIGTVEGQLAELRAMHGRLVAVRAGWDTQAEPPAKTA